MPPLRERGDIAVLASELMRKRARGAGLAPRPLQPDQLERLAAHSWPGNVRELESVLTRFLVSGEIRLTEPPGSGERAENGALDLRSRLAHRRSDSVADAMRRAKGNKIKAAELLGVSRAHLYRILQNTGCS